MYENLYLYIYIYHCLFAWLETFVRKRGKVQIMNVIRASTTVQYHAQKTLISRTNFVGAFSYTSHDCLDCDIKL